MPRIEQHVELLCHTPDPEEIVAMGARLCYSPVDIERTRAYVNKRDRETFIGGIMESGHLSTIEHASFTFGIEGVSRTLLAEITRHRIASFSVQSQRYVSLDKPEGFDYILPPPVAALGEEAVQRFDEQMRTIAQWYREWRAALGGKGEGANENARFVLPGATATRMILTMNARELLHFFSLRCCNRAQWEIRALAWRMLELAHGVAPNIFSYAGPGCVHGECPEGKRSCGRAAEVRAHFEALTSAAREGS